MRSLSFVFAAAAVLAACGNGNDEPTNNGVNDVHAACDIRVSWKRAKEEKCVLCMSAAPLDRCDCEALKEFSGACERQGASYRSACDQAVVDCAAHCADADCGCLDRCYAQADACRARAASRDGCVTETCAPYCQ